MSHQLFCLSKLYIYKSWLLVQEIYSWWKLSSATMTLKMGLRSQKLPIYASEEKINILVKKIFYIQERGGRVVRWCWVNFQCRGVLLIWIMVGQGPIALAVGAGWSCLDIFSLVYRFSFLTPSLWETARYRLKYCLKGPLSPKTTNQPIHTRVRQWKGAKVIKN